MCSEDHAPSVERSSEANVSHLLLSSYTELKGSEIGGACAVPFLRESSAGRIEIHMNTILRNIRLLAVAALAGGFVPLCHSDAQEAGGEAGQETQEANRAYAAHAADGRRRGLPAEVFAVAPGTRFLVSLEQDMNT